MLKTQNRPITMEVLHLDGWIREIVQFQTPPKYILGGIRDGKLGFVLGSASKKKLTLY